MRQIPVSFKTVALIIEAMEFRIAAYKSELEALSFETDADRMSDITNDMAYLEGLLPSWSRIRDSWGEPDSPA